MKTLNDELQMRSDWVIPICNGQERLKEAAKLGFSVAIVPKANAPKGGSVKGMEVIAVERLSEAIDAA